MRRKGQVARSVELPQAVVLGIVVALLPVTARHLGSTLSTDWHLAIDRAGTAGPQVAVSLLGHSFADAAMAVAPLIAALAACSVVAQVAVAGPRPNLSLLRPKFQRISPKSGIKKLVSKQVLWELLRTVAKLGALFLLAYGTWKAGVSKLLASPTTLTGTLSTTGATVRGLLWRVAGLSILVGVADAVVSRRRHNKTMRMTKQEVRDEHRQTEGNPQAKAHLRSRAIKLSRSRMIAAVAKADVVLTNPTHLAVALAYESGSAAPVVVAKGAGVIAEKIRDEARRCGVPLIEHKPLARALFRASEIGDMVPVAFYRAVAEVLAVVYRAKRRPA